VTPPRKLSARDVLQIIRDDEIEWLDLKFVDLFGTLQHVTLPTSAVNEDMLFSGFNFDGSSVRGFTSIERSDMVLRPDTSSCFRDPFFDDPTLSIFCDIIDPDGYKPFSRDPRGVAQRAEQLVRSLGIADSAFFGPELEFFVFDDVRFDQATQHGFFFINSAGAFWNTGRDETSEGGGNLAYHPMKKRAYFAAPPTDHFHNLRSKICKMLTQVGIEVELHHHEVAAAGQNEIGMRFGQLTEQADRALKYKYVVKNTARRYGKAATFMPKPLFEENGSGMHINCSLWKGGENLFFEHGTYGELSDTARHFVGGILHHAGPLCAFTNPTTNSYRRLVPGYEAPMNLVYSASNRSACVRVPFSGSSPKAKRIEFRTPDPSANPYLAFAAVLLAGVDGIRRELEPPPPVDEDVFELMKTERGRSIRSTPGSLEKAIDALEQDHEFLIKDGVFTQDLIDVWIEEKRTEEIDYIALRPHPSEFSLYFDT
jgi:glutamine synthetase